VRRNFQRPTAKFIFQIDPPIIYSDCAQSIAILKSQVVAGYNVVVTGWGRTTVSPYIQYYVEHQLTFCQICSKWTTTYLKSHSEENGSLGNRLAATYPKFPMEVLKC